MGDDVFGYEIRRADFSGDRGRFCRSLRYCFAADESNDISARRYIIVIKGRSAPYAQCPCRQSRPVKVPGTRTHSAAAAHERYINRPSDFVNLH